MNESMAKKYTGRLDKQLFRAIFSLYFLATLLVTAGHTVYDFYNVKEDVLEHLIVSRTTVEEAAAAAVWNYDTPALEALLKGVYEAQIVGSAYVLDAKGKLVASIGDYTQEVIEKREKTDLGKEGLFSYSTNDVLEPDLFKFQFDLTRMSKGQPRKIGQMHLVISENVIIDRVKGSFVLLVVSAIIKTNILFTLFFFMINKKIRTPIRELTDVISNLKIDDKGVDVREGDQEKLEKEKLLTNEIGLMTSVLDQLIGKTNESLDEVNDMKDNLEDMVEERTAEVKCILENVEQGIFMISGPQATVEQHHSSFLKNLLGTDSIVGSNIHHLVFEKSDVEVEKRDVIKDVLSMTLEGDETDWMLNSHLLPKEFSYDENPADSKDQDSDTKNEKIFEIEWSPILRANEDTIARVLVSIRDVTQARIEQKERERQQKELEAIGLILAANQSVLVREFKYMDSFLEATVERLEKGHLDSDFFANACRDLHTLKGNFRSLKIAPVTNTIHHTEDIYIREKELPLDQVNIQDLIDNTLAIKEEYSIYRSIYYDKLGGGESSDGKPSQEFVDTLWSGLVFDRNIDSLIPKIETFVFPEITTILEVIIAGLEDVSKQLGKPAPKLHIDDHFIYSTKGQDFLPKIFTHLFRNSLDHGIEDPATRVEKGKPESGAIYLESLIDDQGRPCLKFWDDGGGLNLKVLRKKLQEKGRTVSNDLEVAYSIFESDLSTKEEVSDISGRGIGMDSVKAMLENEGGQIEMNLHGDEGADKRPFELNIILTSDLAWSRTPQELSPAINAISA